MASCPHASVHRLLVFVGLVGLLAVWPTLADSDNGASHVVPPDELVSQPPPNPHARGWNDAIDWVSFDEGLEMIKSQKKPMFLLIHKSWCPACQQLKPKIAKAKNLVPISKYFIMVNTQDDEEPWEEKYKPDGGYIPRILFLDLEGNVMDYIKNPTESFEKYTHYYTNPTPIIKSMKEVLLKLKILDEKRLAQFDDGGRREAAKTEL